MKQRRYRGSITVFAALSIMLVAQLLFTLIEGARWLELHKASQMNTESVLESVFADYCSPLWEEYHILGMTTDNMNGELSFNNRAAQMRKLSLANLGGLREKDLLSEGTNLLRANVNDVDICSYLLMTDGRGTVFEQAVSAYMKENLAYELAKGIYNNYESIKESQDQYGDGSDKISGALDALEEAKSEGTKSSEQSVQRRNFKGAGQRVRVQAATSEQTKKVYQEDSSGSKKSQEDNPLTTVTEAQKKGILGMVLPERAHLSGAVIQSGMCVSKRTLAQGNAAIPKEEDWYDKTLFTQYICNYMSSYTESLSNHALQYEMEYLVGGKDNDVDNLRVTVDRLLLIREGLNMASIVSMPDKLAEAEALAIAMAGASVNPAIIEAVKYGILAAWAYVESVLDIRALLDGDKISLIKSEATWTSTIDNFPTLLSGWSKAKSCDAGGLDYKQYITSLLLFESGKTMAMRAMDVEEATVRTIEGYQSFRMDHAVCEMEIQETYEWQPIFMMFVPMVTDAKDVYRLIECAHYSYFRGKEDV